MATHPDLKRAMERDGVPSLAAVEQAFGVAHRTLHRYRQADESDHIRTSRALDEWLLGMHRVIREGDAWAVVPGPGPCGRDAEWLSVKRLDEYMAAKADALAAREDAIRTLEREVLALRDLVHREAIETRGGLTCFQNSRAAAHQEIDIDPGETGLQAPEDGATPKSMNVSFILELAARAQGPRAKKGAGPRKTPFTTYLPPSTRIKLDAASAKFGASLGDLVVGALEATLPEAEEVSV